MERITHIICNTGDPKAPETRTRLSFDADDPALERILDETLIAKKVPLRRFVDLHFSSKKKLTELRFEARIAGPATGALDQPMMMFELIFEKGRRVIRDFTTNTTHRWSFSGPGFAELLALLEERGVPMVQNPLPKPVNMLIGHQTQLEPGQLGHFTTEFEIHAYRIPDEIDEMLEGTTMGIESTLKQLLLLHLEGDQDGIEALRSASEAVHPPSGPLDVVERLVFTFDGAPAFDTGDLATWNIRGPGYDRYLEMRWDSNRYHRE